MKSILRASVTLDEFEKYGHPSTGGKLNFYIAFQKFAMFIYIKKFSHDFRLWVMKEMQIKADKLHI